MSNLASEGVEGAAEGSGVEDGRVSWQPRPL